MDNEKQINHISLKSIVDSDIQLLDCYSRIEGETVANLSGFFFDTDDNYVYELDAFDDDSYSAAEFVSKYLKKLEKSFGRNINKIVVISDLEVAVEYRGRGVGKNLMLHVENFLSKLPVDMIILFARDRNDHSNDGRLVSFYEYLGYRRVKKNSQFMVLNVLSEPEARIPPNTTWITYNRPRPEVAR